MTTVGVIIETKGGVVKKSNLGVLTAAHAKAAEEGYDATDDVGLVQGSGTSVKHVQGCYDNVKITTPDDWKRATDFWPLWERVLRMEEEGRSVVTRGS